MPANDAWGRAGAWAGPAGERGLFSDTVSTLSHPTSFAEPAWAAPFSPSVIYAAVYRSACRWSRKRSSFSELPSSCGPLTHKANWDEGGSSTQRARRVWSDGGGMPWIPALWRWDSRLPAAAVHRSGAPRRSGPAQSRHGCAHAD